MANINNNDIDINSNILSIFAELSNDHESPTQPFPKSPKVICQGCLEIVTPRLGRVDVAGPSHPL